MTQGRYQKKIQGDQLNIRHRVGAIASQIIDNNYYYILYID